MRRRSFPCDALEVWIDGMRTVIFGLARSGTTALFYKIKNSYPPDTICLFEPQEFDARTIRSKKSRAFLSWKREPNVLAKVLPFRPGRPANVDGFSDFEKQILLVRDSRDRLISRLLYGVLGSNFWDSDSKLGLFIEKLKQKEFDPKSVQLKTIVKTFADLNGESFSFDGWFASYRYHSIENPLAFHDARTGLLVFRYEEMIDKRFGGLEEYLGLSLRGEASVAATEAHVSRTKGYGNWRDWFTAEDIEYFRPLLQPILDRYYSRADWDLNATPAILSEHSSRYIVRIVNEKRALMNCPPYFPPHLGFDPARNLHSL